MSNNQIKEINKIMEDYTTKQPTKLDQLKSLDRKVKRPATVFDRYRGRHSLERRPCNAVRFFCVTAQKSR